MRKTYPDDLEASTLLATVYQRLGDLIRSDQAVERVLAREAVGAYDRAEALSLRGRNAKSRWTAEWEGLPAEQQRVRALGSGFLEDAANSYADAFKQNLNHFYSGLNALAMLTIESALAAALPAVWEERFEESAEAARQLEARRKQSADLAAAVGLSIWQRNNLWELYNALAAAGDDLTLIALWNGQQGDGPGGTADLVEKAAQRGAKTIILDTKSVFGP